MSLFRELRRRNVFRVGIAYLVAAWVLAQVADLVLENVAAPDWVMQVILLLLGLGFPLALIFAWAFELTPEGPKLEKDVDRSQSVTAHGIGYHRGFTAWGLRLDPRWDLLREHSYLVRLSTPVERQAP